VQGSGFRVQGSGFRVWGWGSGVQTWRMCPSRPPIESKLTDLVSAQSSIQEQILSRNVKRFRGGLVFKAHRLLYHSTLGWRVIERKKKSWCQVRLRSIPTFQTGLHADDRREGSPVAMGAVPVCSRFRANMEQLKRFHRLLPESQGQIRKSRPESGLDCLYVPYSLDSGTRQSCAQRRFIRGGPVARSWTVEPFLSGLESNVE